MILFCGKSNKLTLVFKINFRSIRDKFEFVKKDVHNKCRNRFVIGGRMRYI